MIVVVGWEGMVHDVLFGVRDRCPIDNTAIGDGTVPSSIRSYSGMIIVVVIVDLLQSATVP